MVSPGVCHDVTTTRLPPTVPVAGSASPEPVRPCGIQSLVLSSPASSQQKPAGFSAAARYVPWQSGRALRLVSPSSVESPSGGSFWSSAATRLP